MMVHLWLVNYGPGWASCTGCGYVQPASGRMMILLLEADRGYDGLGIP